MADIARNSDSRAIAPQYSTLTSVLIGDRFTADLYFDRQSIEIDIQPYCMGVFSQRNSPTKHQYVAGK